MVDAAAAAAAAVVHEGYLTCIVVSSLVGRPFIKANRRCVWSSSILFDFTYLTYLHFFHFCFYFRSHFLADFGGWFFYFSFFSAIPIVGSVAFPLSFDDDRNSEQQQPY